MKPVSWVKIEFYSGTVVTCDRCSETTEEGYAEGQSWSEARGKSPRAKLCMPCLAVMLGGIISAGVIVVPRPPPMPGSQHPERN